MWLIFFVQKYRLAKDLHCAFSICLKTWHAFPKQPFNSHNMLNFSSRVEKAHRWIQFLCSPITAPITEVQIQTPLKAPVEGQSYTMNCNVTGAVDHVCWWKDGLLMSSNNRTDFAVDNQTLIINPIQHSDMGDYKCQAMNAVSNMTSNAYSLVVNCEYSFFQYGDNKMLYSLAPSSPSLKNSQHFTPTTC